MIKTDPSIGKPKEERLTQTDSHRRLLQKAFLSFQLFQCDMIDQAIFHEALSYDRQKRRQTNESFVVILLFCL
ncbi:hypothetical protein CJ483_04630 [Bacillus sp. PK3_68]|nr:hypothetical protein CJ483_04630 [Bacillus sp. PK3_68]